MLIFKVLNFPFYQKRNIAVLFKLVCYIRKKNHNITFIFITDGETNCAL